METKEAMQMIKAMTPRANGNRISVKIPMLVLMARAWEQKDGTKSYSYTGFSAEFGGIVEFNSPKVYPVNKPAEIVLTLVQFRAYEDVPKKA